MARLSLDTNILVYAIDPTHPEKHLRAKELMRRGAAADLVLTQQVIGEYLNFVLRRMPERHATLRESAERLCRAFPLLRTPPSLLLAAYDRAIRYKLQFWDALIVSVCLANGVTLLLSEDLQDRQMIDGLTVLDPFNADNSTAVEAVMQGAG